MIIEDTHQKKKISSKQKKIIKHIISSIIIIVLIMVWFFIVKYGITLGKMYIDDALMDIEMRNIENHQSLTNQNSILNKDIATLNIELDHLREEVVKLNSSIGDFSLEAEALKSSIDFIDTSVSNSIVVQSDIGVKIQELDTRIKELKKSLNILLEGPK